MNKASTKQSGERSTDRVFEALATIAGLLDRTLNEMKAIDSEFQERLLQAVHDTEASLQSQTTKHMESASAEWESERHSLKAEIERLESALAAAQKPETIAGLLDRALNEMKAIDSEFQERLQQAVHGTKASLQSHTEKHMESASAEWESERRSLKAEIERLESALAAAQNQETEKSAEPPVDDTNLTSEIERVENLIKEVSAVVANPGTPMQTVIRKNIERAELEGYLKGIRYKFESR